MTKQRGVRVVMAAFAAGAALAAAIAAYAQESRPLKKEFDRWDNGTVRACRVYDDSGALVGRAVMRPDGSVHKTERYDREGRKIEEAYYDPRGNLTTSVDGWAARRWRYVGDTLRAQISFGEDGRPVEKKLYDERGRIAVRLLADDGSLDPYDEVMPKTFYDQQIIAYFKNAPVRDDESIPVRVTSSPKTAGAQTP